MSIVLVDRSTSRASSLVVLGKRVFYISNPDDPNHAGRKKKLILGAQNYNVPDDDQSPEAFISAVVRTDTEYTECRTGKRGKCSRRVFEELIFSTEPGAWLTEEERDEIEKRIVSRFGGMSVCRTAWHIDEKTGRCDLHVLLSAKNLDFPPTMTLWAEFGGRGRDHLYAAMDSLDIEITRYLNRTPERQQAKLKSAQRRHRELTTEFLGKRTPLDTELARFFLNRKRPGELDEKVLISGIKSLGHEIVGPIGRTVSIRFNGRKKLRRYNLTDLHDRTLVELKRIQDENPGDLG